MTVSNGHGGAAIESDVEEEFKWVRGKKQQPSNERIQCELIPHDVSFKGLELGHWCRNQMGMHGEGHFSSHGELKCTFKRKVCKETLTIIWHRTNWKVLY